MRAETLLDFAPTAAQGWTDKGRSDAMYYLFMRKKKDLEKYRREFERVSAEIKNGKTPVFSELRKAKTDMFEAIPYYGISGAFLIGGTVLLNALNISNIFSIAAVLIVNSICNAVAFYVFSIAKHFLRLKLCDRLGVPRDEHSIAVMESLEYQSV